MLPRIKYTKAQMQQFERGRKAFEKKQAEDAPPPALAEHDPNLPNCVIVDIDQTLGSRGNRGIYEFEKSGEDEIIEPIKWLVQILMVGMSRDDYFFFITGREEKFREVTNKWLENNGLRNYVLFMRPTGDFRPAEVVKEEIWINNILRQYNVRFILDDNKKTLDLFRSHGVYTLLAEKR